MPVKNESAPVGRQFGFAIGLFLLLANIPVGIGAMMICSSIAITSDKPVFYLILGSAIYVFSWILFGIGISLAGRRGYHLSKHVVRNALSRFIKKGHEPESGS